MPKIKKAQRRDSPGKELERAYNILKDQETKRLTQFIIPKIFTPLDKIRDFILEEYSHIFKNVVVKPLGNFVLVEAFYTPL